MKRIIEYILGYFIVIIFPISNIFASDYPSIVENDDVIGKYYGTSPIASLTFKGKATNVNIESIIDVLGGTGIMFYDEVEDSRINAQIWIRSGTTGIRFRSIVRDSEFGASLLNQADPSGACKGIIFDDVVSGCKFDYFHSVIDYSANVIGPSIFYGNVLNTTFTNSDLEGIKFYGNLFNVDFINCTRSFKFYGTLLNDVTFTNTNLTGISFINTKFQNVAFYGVNMSKIDLRGADLSGITGEYSVKNTIMPDGTIHNLSLMTSEDSFSISKYVKTVSDASMTIRSTYSEQEISAKISEADTTISTGAILTLEDGAVLEILNEKTLSLSEGGIIEFCLGDNYTEALLYVNENSTFLYDGGDIVINISDPFLDGNSYILNIIHIDGTFLNYEQLSRIANFKIQVNGVEFTGDWDPIIDSSGISLSFQSVVPEPSTYAAIFGALALAFAAYRRRK